VKRRVSRPQKKKERKETLKKKVVHSLEEEEREKKVDHQGLEKIPKLTERGPSFENGRKNEKRGKLEVLSLPFRGEGEGVGKSAACGIERRDPSQRKDPYSAQEDKKRGEWGSKILCSWKRELMLKGKED